MKVAGLAVRACLLYLTLTSNLEFSKWTEVMGDHALAGAFVDRLTHHAHIIQISGDSYRFKNSLQTKKSQEKELNGGGIFDDQSGGVFGFQRHSVLGCPRAGGDDGYGNSSFQIAVVMHLRVDGTNHLESALIKNILRHFTEHQISQRQPRVKVHPNEKSQRLLIRRLS